jgi:ferritin
MRGKTAKERTENIMDETMKALDDATAAFVSEQTEDEAKLRAVAELCEAAELIRRLEKEAANE